MKSYLLTLVTVLVLVVADAQPPRTSWPMIGGDATHSSFAEIDLSFPLKLSRTYHLGIFNESGISVSEDHLFIGDAGDPNKLIVGELSSGNVIWSYGLPNTGGGMNFVPTYSDGVVMVGGQGGAGLYAFDVLSGDSLWLLPVNSLYTRAPVVDDGRVYVPSGNGLVCADIQTGDVFWSFDESLPQICPVLYDDHVFFCTSDTLYCADKFTGDIQWKNSAVEVGHFTAFAVDNAHLYVGYLDNVTALHLGSGDVAWNVPLTDSAIVVDFPGAFAMTEDHLLIKYFDQARIQNQYLVLDKTTSAELNRFTGGSIVYSGPTIINDYVVEALDGNVRFMHLLTGDLAYEMTGLSMSSYPSQVIVANDKIYIAGNFETVLVLESAVSSIRSSYSTLNASVFPNPATNFIDVSFTIDQNDDITFELVAVDGTTVLNHNLGFSNAGEHRVAMDVSHLFPGVYCAYLKGAAQRGMLKIAIAPR